MMIKAKLLPDPSVCAACKNRECMYTAANLVCSRATSVTILGFSGAASAHSRDHLYAIIALKNGAITTAPIEKLLYTEEDK